MNTADLGIFFSVASYSLPFSRIFDPDSRSVLSRDHQSDFA
jgi:hypothetical protein